MAMHDEWNDRLSEYIDGELTPSEQRALEAHLAGCAGCQADLASLRAVVTRTEALTDRPPASDLWPRHRGTDRRTAHRANDARHATVRVHAAAARRRQPGVDCRVGRHGLAGADGRPDDRLPAGSG
jgi:anti-sigma factor RsiW